VTNDLTTTPGFAVYQRLLAEQNGAPAPTPLRVVTPEPDPEPEQHRGQLRFAKRFTRDYDGEFLHAHGIGWHEYDGARWAECRDGAETRAVLILLKGALGELPDLDGPSRSDLIYDIRRVESAAGVNGVLDLAQNMHPCTVAAERMDADPHLLNTRSGTVNITTGGVRAPRPEDHLSKVTRAEFNPNARSAVFDTFLTRIQPDPEMRAFLARQLGSALLGVVRDHVLLIWNGTGANGKGTLRDAVKHALGDYAVEVPADILLLNRNGQQGMAPERMRLKGARVAFCSEIANGAKLDEATMKKLTGGDPVNAKLLYRNPIEFDPTHTLVMLTNHLPQVRGDDPATWRRILSVPFDQVIPVEDRDGELPEKLKADPEAILAWLWAGWLDYQRNGLNPPQAVLDATRKYQLDSDVLARFLADEDAVTVGGGSAQSAVLYRTFMDWVHTQGEEIVMSNKSFSEAMELRGYSRKTLAGYRVWKGLMIVTKDDPRDREGM
jgi:putative DNA primase/helicase